MKSLPLWERRECTVSETTPALGGRDCSECTVPKRIRSARNVQCGLHRAVAISDTHDHCGCLGVYLSSFPGKFPEQVQLSGGEDMI